MPNYYDVYPTFGQNISTSPYTIPQPFIAPQRQGSSQYMISVDGELAARAWQIPNNLPPNTIIPLWDLDGQHVYFKSVDAYGRMNPIKKGRIVFDEDSTPTNLPNVSQQSAPVEIPDMSKYLTKEDFEGFKTEIKNMIQSIHQNQNGSNYRNNGRGDNK